MPNPLRLAVIARAHFDTVRLPFPPAWIQRVGLMLGAPRGPARRLPADLRAEAGDRQGRPGMTRRRRLRRRLLWAGVLFGLVLLVAALSVLDAALGVRDRVVASRRSRHTDRTVKRMPRPTAIA